MSTKAGRFAVPRRAELIAQQGLLIAGLRSAPLSPAQMRRRRLDSPSSRNTNSQDRNKGANRLDCSECRIEQAQLRGEEARPHSDGTSKGMYRRICKQESSAGPVGW